MKTGGLRRVSSALMRTRSVDRVKTERQENLAKIQYIENSKFGIVLAPEVSELKEKVLAQHVPITSKILPLPLYVGDITGIQIEDLHIEFKLPTL